MRNTLLPLALIAVSGAAAAAQSGGGTQDALRVTPDNFKRAETDMYFKMFASRSGFGKFYNLRDLPLEGTGVRPNRDTLYSQAVFDLEAGPVTITMPDAGGRFMSMFVVDQDHYVQDVSYGPGVHRLSTDNIDTRYVFVALRTLVNPGDAADMDTARGLQDAVKVEQPGGPGKLDVPTWDKASQDKIRAALQALGETLPELRLAFGRKDQVDPVRHLIGTASAWGGNPDKDAIYLNVVPAKNDGKTAYQLAVKDVPVDGFWSITLYDVQGRFQPNALNAYSVNNITAAKAPDGSVAVQFGDCDGKVPNCLPIMPGWNYMVRLYRPRAEILDGSWKFPEARPRM